MKQRKIMIALPMRGRTDEEIETVRWKIEHKLQAEGWTIVNTYFKKEWLSRESMRNAGVLHIPLRFISEAIRAMSECDAVFFAKGWQEARGCRTEHQIATEYGVQILYEE